MAASLEVRVPFMDLELMRLAASMPGTLKLHGTTTKYVLQKAMRALRCRADAVRARRPASARRCGRWIARGTAPSRRRVAARRRTRAQPRTLRRRRGAAPVDDNDAGRADHAYLIYALLNLELWMRTFVDRRGEGIVA